MASFARGLRLGAGLVGLGYGIYRLSRGRRDWVTSTAMTTGVSLALASLTGRRTRRLVGPVTALVSSVGWTPRFRRDLVARAPRLIIDAGAAMMNAFR